MKLRIRGNSIRLRLTKTEVQKIAEGAFVKEVTHFLDGQTLQYILNPNLNVTTVKAECIDNRVIVSVPMKLAKEWASSQTVSIQTEQDNLSASKLSILIEKDFACLKPRQNEKEDESDMYFNPNTHSGTCG